MDACALGAGPRPIDDSEQNSTEVGGGDGAFGWDGAAAGWTKNSDYGIDQTIGISYRSFTIIGAFDYIKVSRGQGLGIR